MKKIFLLLILCSSLTWCEAQCPSKLSVEISKIVPVTCYGDSNAIIDATPLNGISPYTYSWTGIVLPIPQGGSAISPSTPEDSIVTGQPAGTYTVTVKDSCGTTATVVAIVTQPAAVAVPNIMALGMDSTRFVLVKPDTSINYSWTLADFGTTYSGTGDTIFLPVYPRKGTLYYYATNKITSCVAIDSIGIFHYIDTSYNPPANLPVARWSKRGVFLEKCCNYINVPDSETSVVNYCREGHINYVLLDGTSWFGGPCAVFSQDSVHYDTMHARWLEDFIDSLKTRGNVQQVGVIVYEDTTTHPWHDSNSQSVVMFNVQNRVKSIYLHNLGLLWNRKIDYLSLDQEFWGNPSNYLYQFHAYHMPMLKAMYEAAHECPEGNLRVEDYLEEPINPGNGSFHINDATDTMMADSIALYADRILNSCYSSFPVALWNEADFRLAYPNFGDHPNKNMEIWPVFDASNYNNSNCTECWDFGDNENYLGYDMCAYGETPDYMEQQYFDSLSVSLKKKIFSDNIGGGYGQDSMGGDTNFQILGNAWFQYVCLRNFYFDTNTNGTGSNIHFYVTLPHDIQWFYPSVMPDTMPSFVITATVHGGTPPYNYIWYDMDSNRVLQSSTHNKYKVTWSPTYSHRIRVLAIDSADSTATDYMLIYKVCTPPVLEKPVKPAAASKSKTILNNSKVTIYPNPNTGSFTMELSGVSGQYSVEIYNVMGEKVYSQCNVYNSPFVINFSSKSDGMYFYRVISESGGLIGSGKVIIEK